jgi:ketosteroid isomerase-like protein
MATNRTTTCLIAILAFASLLGGCASAPNSKLAAHYPKVEAQIRVRLDEIIDAAQSKDFDRLDSYHLYGGKFTKFAPEAAGRLEAEAARKGEHDGLGAATDLRMQADALKIDVFRDVAIATFILNYSFKGPTGIIEKKANTTMVFVKDGGTWEIAHEHLSTPKPNP